jgi:plasmid stabilization system protein ParE
MEVKIVVKGFRNNTLKVYQYLLKEYSPRIAYFFLDKIEQRINLVAKNPTIGKPSLNKKDIRSIILSPHNLIFYRYRNNTVEILSLFDMRKHPKKRPY